MKIGDEVYVHGYVDEIRNGTIIIRNEGGYFGTAPDEVMPTAAKEMGYKLMPIAPYEKLKACTCGCKRRNRWYVSGKREGIKLVCCKCGKEAFGETKAEARRNWNRMIEEERA